MRLSSTLVFTAGNGCCCYKCSCEAVGDVDATDDVRIALTLALGVAVPAPESVVPTVRIGRDK